jgi:hypothetical protein
MNGRVLVAEAFQNYSRIKKRRPGPPLFVFIGSADEKIFLSKISPGVPMKKH